LSTFCEGASVAVVDVDEAGVHAVVGEITANGGKAIVADLREPGGGEASP
jgi:hypothetical protein